tara:strand:+ start:515 stop:940 length:426 start_codon:yes stop_codon:yes gene_type:complete
MEHWIKQISDNKLYANIYNECADPEVNSFLITVIDKQTRVKSSQVFPRLGSARADHVIENQRAIEFIFGINSTGYGINGLSVNSQYDVIIREQTSTTNTDPTDSSILGIRWRGLATIDDASEVEYTQHANPTTRNYVYIKS